jgi:flagellar export protein FliJ
MPFHFSLQPLLRLRQSLEQREQLRLEIVVKEVVRTRQELEALEQEHRASAHRLSVSMQSGMRGAELHFQEAAATARLQVILDCRHRLGELERLRVAQLAVLHKARQDREILESIRQRQMDLYRQEQKRREQQRVDELFLFARQTDRTR